MTERDESRHCGACDGHDTDEPVPYDCGHEAEIARLRDDNIACAALEEDR